jgi:hypothetical protein
MNMNNDALHKEAVKLLVAVNEDRKKSADARTVANDYNARRRANTEALRPILTQIWDALARGETVGGYTGKEAWAKGQGITIRHVQKIIAGPKRKNNKANSVRLTVGKVVKIGDSEYALTQEMLDAITKAVPTPTAKPEKVSVKRPVHSIAQGPTAEEFGIAGQLTSCGKELTDRRLIAKGGEAVTCILCLKAASEDEQYREDKKALAVPIKDELDIKTTALRPSKSLLVCPQ